MTIEYLLYAGGYITCMLSILTGAAALWLSRRNLPKTEPVIVSLAGFTVMPCLYTMFAPAAVTNPLRAFCAIGIASVYLTARSLPRHWLERALRLAGVAVAIVVLFEAVITLGGRPAFLANPNMTASWLLLCWPWMPWWLAVPGVLATQSRAAIAGLTIAGLAMVLLRSRLGVKTRLGLLAFVGLIVPWAAYLRWATVRDRMTTWVMGLRLFWVKPLAGWGPGASQLLGRDHFDSAPLTVGVEMGTVGLIAFGVLVFGLAWIAWRSKSPARWALLAIAIQNIADDTWLWPVTALLLGITLALVEDNNDALRLVPDHLFAALRRFRIPGIPGTESLPEDGDLVEGYAAGTPAIHPARYAGLLGAGGESAPIASGPVLDRTGEASPARGGGQP